MIRLIVTILVFIALFGCSLPPMQPVTKRELINTGVFRKFIIEQPAEEILYALNTRGEVVVEGKRNIPGRDFPVYVKLLATADGVHLLEYDR